MADKSFATNTIISHTGKADINLDFYKRGIDSQKEPAMPLAAQHDLLTQLTEFELGRSLLKNQGLSGYWTSYIIRHAPLKKDLHPLEDWIVNKAPVVRATQERFQIFQEQLRTYIQEGGNVASLPCGLMDDLLTLDLDKKASFTGVDLDQESLKFAHQNAQEMGIDTVTFLQKDAWDLGLSEAFDVLTSNGLNIYEPDPQRLTALYQEFYKVLKPRGVLITSFLTPPPQLDPTSPWRDYDAADLLKQKVLMGDIVQTKWQSYCTESQMRSYLESAGFQVIDVIYDNQAMFPTVVARR